MFAWQNVSSEIRPPLYNRSADNSVVSASFLMTTTTRRPLIPILNAETLNGDHLDSDESFLKPVDGMESYNGQPNNHKPPPEYDPMLPGLHRPQIQGHRPLPGSIKKNGLYEAGPIKTTKTTDSTTLPTTLRPRTAKPAKDALSSSLTFGKLPAITLGNIRHPIQPFLQEDISSVPVTGGKPAIITNPYINIDLSPEIKLLGIKIQKQFGLQLGIKIVKPQRFFHRPFSFLTPLIGGAVLSKPPPADLVPVLPHDSDEHVVDYHHAAGALPSVHSSTQGAPPFLFAPLRPTHDSHEAPYSHSDIIIGRKSRTPVMEEETQSKVRMRTPKL
ncbi:uncharacterized protein LOC111273116 [Varroa jacobsoni]|uniref:uncharacterized protein LOC111273116 n=1 Tax=Varroa jacobsoni TaxID=62625 RepID=UPI000BF55BFC|nr:uncharacterized protein LOC111273116 [Varroa jacobsoni]